MNFLSIFSIDSDILLYVQDHIRCGFLDKVFPFITKLGDAGIFWIILSLVLLCFKKTRKAGAFSAGALIGYTGRCGSLRVSHYSLQFRLCG